MQLRQPDRGAVEPAARKDVGQRGLRRLGARPWVLGHVAEGPASQNEPARGVVLAGHHLEQAGLARAVAPDEADLVPDRDDERRVRQDTTPGDVDGEITYLQHPARCYVAGEAAFGQSQLSRPGGRSKNEKAPRP